MVEHTRTLDFKIAFAIGLGTMIAAGIFSLSGTAVAEIGSSAVIAFVIAAVIAGITAAAYSEFASIYSENGGGYLFTSRTFEDREYLTYGIGMSLFLGYTGTTAFYLATMDEWFVRFVLPEQLAWLPHGSTAVLAAVLLGVLNARGTEESGTFQLLVSGAKVAVLIAFIAGAFTFRGPTTAVGNFTAQFSTDIVGILSIAALAFITFFGFSAIAASAGEIIEPRKTVPRAIAASIITVTVLYALVIVAMTNSTVPPEVIAREGETAMGEVAAGFLGPIGRSLIVAGAVFSMVSASNASILAASSIGSLMGRRGQAPRAFARIHSAFRTPFWSVTAATGAIVTLIVVFIALFPSEGGIAPINLGLTVLTGFATFNLLLPLAIVNGALIYHRRAFPDIERGFRVPGVPVVPVLGILANLGLIYNLPRRGVVTGVGLTVALLGIYLAWGGQREIDELVRRVYPPEPARGEEAETERSVEPDREYFRVLVPIARPDNAPAHVRLAELLAAGQKKEPLIEVVTVTEIPDQTPHEVMADVAGERVERIEEVLENEDLSVEYTVEGHTCRDVAFDILQSARTDGVDLILMGYPEENDEITKQVEYTAPCDVVFASGIGTTDVERINIGAGGGPHHLAAAKLVRQLGEQGIEVNVISVDPVGEETAEDPARTVSELNSVPDLHVYNVSAASIGEGLVEKAKSEGGILVIGASRDRRLRQWVFGSTPDSVIQRAKLDGVPVLVYASSTSVPEQIEDYLFPVYRYLLKWTDQVRGETGRRTVET
ncbi:amino acid permease [Natronomonas sp. F2-12]|jgi:amino acid transporter/nucleotide-binding universal stress UspA family protein|uniref:Amino acid permease n=1 Tax=Natronomonas aquatica TaxID=2841590 RepID=A0A9R1D5P4_9EURY|nr:amino acid permease [Natronomonas aquatica]MCQ4334544.1 amino acid permease [Natronomonas aquatica]